ncbi:hypothetical protein [Desulfurobacterium atlanticum]|nr:hypothetical protein [Desulfurobacterium atlanticum]
MEKVQDEITSAQATTTGMDVVYWEPVSGDDSNDGKTKDTPVKTFSKALSLVKPGGMIAIYPLQNITINATTPELEAGLNTTIYIDKDLFIGLADEYYIEGKTEAVNIGFGSPGQLFIKSAKVSIGISKATLFAGLHLYNATLDVSVSEAVETVATIDVNRSVLKVNNLTCNGAITGDNFYYLIKGTVNFPGAAYLADVRFGIGTLSIAQVSSFTLSDGSTLTDISGRILGIRKDSSGKPLNIICDVEI